MLEVCSVRNTPVRVETSNGWEKQVKNGKVVYADNRIDIQLKGHLSLDELKETSLFKSGSITGTDLLKMGKKLAENPAYKNLLSGVSDDSIYSLQSFTPDGSTKPMRYRQVDWSSGKYTMLTVKVVQPTISVEMSL